MASAKLDEIVWYQGVWACVNFMQESIMEIVHYFQNGFHHGHLVEKNLDFMDFLCIWVGSGKINHPIQWWIQDFP